MTTNIIKPNKWGTLLILFALTGFYFTSHAQGETATHPEYGYSIEVHRNSDYNFSIVAVPNYDSTIDNTFSPGIFSFGITIELPLGITLDTDIENIQPSGIAVGNNNIIFGSQIGPPYDTHDYYIINTNGSNGWLPYPNLPHQAFEPTELLNFDVVGNPTEGILKVIDVDDPINSHPLIMQGFTPHIVGRLKPNLNGLIMNLTGVTEYSFETLDLTEVNTESFGIYPNPLDTHDTHINYEIPSGVTQLDISMYDINGRLVNHWDDVTFTTGVNTLKRPTNVSGLYFLNFSFNNGASTVKHKLVIE